MSRISRLVGELQVYDGDQPINYDIRSRILKFDGQTPHGVARIGSGVRISFVVYKRNVNHAMDMKIMQWT